MAENLLTLEELSARWGLPEDFVLDLAQRGWLESVEQPGWAPRLYPESALAVYFESKGLAIEYSDEG